jgi:hypothetical protein
MIAKQVSIKLGEGRRNARIAHARDCRVPVKRRDGGEDSFEIQFCKRPLSMQNMLFDAIVS